MFVVGVMAWQLVLALHILAVVVSFGLVFAWPLLAVLEKRLDARAMPTLHHVQWTLHMRVSAPALGVVALAGIYVASHLDAWDQFYVGWGIAAVVAIGAIGGVYLSPREKRLEALATDEVAAAGSSSEVSWSPEYLAVRRQAEAARVVQAVITILTIVFMTLQTG